MTIRDISERGARIETSFALQLDSLHDFRLSLDSRRVVVKGRVLHCQIASIGDGSVLYRSGLEFVEPSPHVREAITAFVEAHRAALAAGPRIIDAEPIDD